MLYDVQCLSTYNLVYICKVLLNFIIMNWCWSWKLLYLYRSIILIDKFVRDFKCCTLLQSILCDPQIYRMYVVLCLLFIQLWNLCEFSCCYAVLTMEYGNSSQSSLKLQHFCAFGHFRMTLFTLVYLHWLAQILHYQSLNRFHLSD